MKLKSRFIRVSLIAAAMTAVSLPLINQLRNNHATAQDAPPATGQPAGVPISVLPQVDPKKVILSYGDQKVTAGEFAAFFADLDPQLQQRVLAHPEAKRQLAEQYIDLKLMAEQAKRQKLDQSTRVKTTYDQLLANALMVSLSEQKDANLAFYNENKNYFDELQARHILVAVEGSGVGGTKLNDAQAKAKAEDIRKRLDTKPEDFATIARTESDDKGSAATGGSLGTMSRGQMVPPFENAAFSLKDNEISQPIKTQFGYHIIQVLGRTPMAYDQVAQRVPQRRLQLLLEQLKKAEKPELDDSYFGAGEQKAASTPPAGNAPQPSAVPATK